MFRISYRGERIDEADTIEAASEIVRRELPGRYHVHEVRLEPFSSGNTVRAWGQLVRHPDGQVEAMPWPWASLQDNRSRRMSSYLISSGRLGNDRPVPSQSTSSRPTPGLTCCDRYALPRDR